MPESPPTDQAAATDPDGQALYDALTEAGTSHPVAYNAVGGVRNMSGQTVAAEIRAQSTKLDTSNARFESKLDALQNEIRSQRAMIWTLIAILGAAVVGGLGALIAQALK